MEGRIRESWQPGMSKLSSIDCMRTGMTDYMLALIGLFILARLHTRMWSSESHLLVQIQQAVMSLILSTLMIKAETGSILTLMIA
jgi:hypothetical protein